MNNSIRNTWPVVLLFFLITILQGYFVVDRVIAAWWSWYKFKDYDSNGHIMLNQETGLWFLFFSIAIFIAGFGIRKDESALKAKIIKTSQWTILLNVIFYLLLALSPLNQWRA